jgi:hypothetical protein
VRQAQIGSFKRRVAHAIDLTTNWEGCLDGQSSSGEIALDLRIRWGCQQAGEPQIANLQANLRLYLLFNLFKCSDSAGELCLDTSAYLSLGALLASVH